LERVYVVKLTVLYGHPEDPQAFDDHYKNTHTPLVDKIPNLKNFEYAKVVGTPDGGEPEQYAVAELWFDDMETFEASMGGDEGQTAAGDLPNFASGGATMLVCEVE
jgi:uncharacterized protein (TIGR02118 family)